MSLAALNRNLEFRTIQDSQLLLPPMDTLPRMKFTTCVVATFTKSL